MTGGTNGATRRWRVERDPQWVPRCHGANLEDAVYAQGWACAHDRAWQIESRRRRTVGELAAWSGVSEHAALDELAVAAELDTLARRCWQRLRTHDPVTARWLSAYVDGVNDGLDEGVARSPEMTARGLQAGRWEPWSPLAIFAEIHLLFGSYPHQLWAERVTDRLGPEWLPVLAPGHATPVLAGSNAWALTPSRTQHGAPLLSADPHRVLEWPGIYQQVHLIAEDEGVDVIGLAFPGVPGVPHFGHAGSVAWVITNAMAAAQDLVEDDADGGEQAGRDGGRGDDSQGDDHGAGSQGDSAPPPPLVLPAAGARGPRRLATPAWRDAELGVSAWRELLLARTVGDVDTALDAWVEPVNAVLVADRSGAVLERVAGRTMQADATGSGRQVPDGDHVVHANHASELTTPFGRRFAAPYRAERIDTLLRARDRWDLGGCVEVQGDVLDPTWPVLRGLLAELASTRPDDPVLEQLMAADGQMARDSHDATLIDRWRTAFVAALAEHPRLATLADPGELPEVYLPWLWLPGRLLSALPEILAHGPGLGIDVQSAAASALDAMSEDLTEELRPWGEEHRVAPMTILGTGGIPGAGPVKGAPLGPLAGGSEECVHATSAVGGWPHRGALIGPAARLVWDLGDRSRSRWAVPFGADGVAEEHHASDQSAAWSDGGLWAVPAGAVETLAETPAGPVTLQLLDPTSDAALVHAWTSSPRGRFWGMQDQGVEEVAETYRFVASLGGHDAYLLRIGGRLAALVQIYDATLDPLAEVAPIQAGDVGLHFFSAPPQDRVLPEQPLALLQHLARWLITVRGARRVLGEPDADNARVADLLTRGGFDDATADGSIQLGDKVARFVVVTPSMLGLDDGRPPTP